VTEDFGIGHVTVDHCKRIISEIYKWCFIGAPYEGLRVGMKEISK
jgi:hypothetical protein